MKRILSLTTVLLLSVCIITSCSSTSSSKSDDSEFTVSGKVTAINDNSITIKVLTGLHVENAIMIIKEDTEYNKDISHDFVKNNIVTFKVAKKIADTNPLNLIAKKIISNKPL